MITKYKHGKNTWIDLESPNVNEISEVREVFLVPNQLLSNSIQKSSKPTFSRHSEVFFFKLHFPVFNKSNNNKTHKEINFIIGRNYILTIHEDPIEQMSNINKSLEINSIINKQNPYDSNIGHYFFQILEKIHDELSYHLDEISVRVNNIEKSIFNNKVYMINIMSNISHAILDFKENIRLNREIFRLYHDNLRIFANNENDQYYISCIISEYNKAESILDNLEYKLNDLRRTTDSLLNDNTNKTIKVLTTMSFIIFSLTLIASIIGIKPEIFNIVSISDLYLVVGGMLLLAVVMYVYFKDRKWL